MPVLSSRLRAVLLVAALFLVGGVCGAAVERWFHPLGSLTRRRPPFDAGSHERILDRMSRRLDLTLSQRDSIATILREDLASVQAVRARIREEMGEHHARLRARVDSVLTGPQRELLAKTWRRGRSPRSP